MPDAAPAARPPDPQRQDAEGAEPAAVIEVCADGPLLVRGDFALRTRSGQPIANDRATVALCRCGRSAIRPFCDGSHKLVRFSAGEDRETL
ncbi:MAG TPA: CDGSH iron-sulfur domain-containing protein [Pilimelia sp.]|nr:CDGSH iron-sulfur domain-containing protein [Pilimelia sp.]